MKRLRMPDDRGGKPSIRTWCQGWGGDDIAPHLSIGWWKVTPEEARAFAIEIIEASYRIDSGGELDHPDPPKRHS